MNNPLLEKHALPPFKQVQPHHVEEAIDYFITRNLKAIDSLLATETSFSFEGLVLPLEEWEDELNQAWSVVSHLNAVVNTPALREAHQRCLPKLTDYSTKIGQNKKLYQAFLSLKDSPQFSKLSAPEQKLITLTLQDFELSGVGLEEDKRKRFAKLSEELSLLQNQFQNNVLDSTDHWTKDMMEKARLEGVPEATCLAAEAAAEKAGVKGWRLTLDFPCYHAILTFAKDRDLRQEMHQAYSTRASELFISSQWDNTALIENIVTKRHELANLLGFENFAKRSLAKKMAQSEKEVMDFLNNLAQKAKPFAEKEFNELKAFAKEEGLTTLEPWDIAYYSEKLRQKRHALSEELLRPYFPHTQVVQGLFEVLKRLYGLRIVKKENKEVWHENVEFFEVYDETNHLRGQFYLDLFARKQKRGGAWMDEGRVRRKNVKGTLQTPIAFLTCNFRAPLGKAPSLLTHEEVLTLFHEVGHGMHHLLTQMEYSGISGINGVPWDAVELPSQFMENWCWQEEALAFISSHYETHQPITRELIHKMREAKNFQAAMNLIRQLEFGLFDFSLHLEFTPEKGARVKEILERVRKEYSVVPYAPYNRFAQSFSHVFAGGYAAGYYSYLWAEVLAVDAFSRFEEEGIFNHKTGQDFLKKILEKGGSVDPATLYEEFRGRKPSLEPFLKEHGLF